MGERISQGRKDYQRHVQVTNKRFKQKRKKSKMNYDEWRKYNTFKIPKWVKRFVRDRDLDTCHYCGKICTPKKVEQGVHPDDETLNDMLTFDHLVARSKGGSSHDPYNIVVSCQPCNVDKANRDLQEYIDHLESIKEREEV